MNKFLVSLRISFNIEAYITLSIRGHIGYCDITRYYRNHHNSHWCNLYPITT
jgi:hypothetical protein